tara:strand:- start:2955 stop:3095 length:141 start_codon:yes stop_codon:yes gene_type:complete
LLLNVHTKKGASLKPKDLATFPWEQQEKKNSQHGWNQLKALAQKDG